MKRTAMTVRIAVVVVAVAAGGLADIPKVINYQGRLLGRDGRPIEGPTLLSVAIYRQLSGGEPLFKEDHEVVVTEGIFHVIIGSRTHGGVPSRVFEQNLRYLGVTVERDREMEPRQLLTAVPYAYVAETAQTALIAHTSQDLQVPLHIRDSSSQPLLTVQNDGQGPAISTWAVEGNGVAGSSRDRAGVYGSSTNGEGVRAISSQGSQAFYAQASADGAWAARGSSVSNTGETIGVVGDAVASLQGIGVAGNGVKYGVHGSASGMSMGVAGVHGVAAGTIVGVPSYPVGVWGESEDGFGVSGTSQNNIGVHASSHGDHGVFAFSNSEQHAAVYARNSAGNGVVGCRGGSVGVPAFNAGVYGWSDEGPGGVFASETTVALKTFGHAEINGDVFTNGVEYNAPHVHYYTVGGEAFVPAAYWHDYVNGYGQGGAYIVSGAGGMSANVDLPHGARITQLLVFFFDESDSDARVKLNRLHMFSGGYSILAEVESSGADGYISGVDDSVNLPTVDKLRFAYHIYAYSDNWDSDHLRVMGAVISYEIDQAP